MSDDENKKQEELKKIEDELKSGGLSRRNFLNRLSAAGVAFGAAVALGMRDADAAVGSEAGVDVSSTNPAVDDILAEGKEAEAAAAGEEGDPLQSMAQYRRYFRYRRYARRYPRYFRYARYRRYFRYARYRRYGRYGRFYSRFF
jgi:secreted PhoX family phosphatase